jgi:hypothetical protein
MIKTNDPLDGYRARTEQDDENEEMVRSIRGLTSRGVDLETIADVVASQDLIEALNSDSILAKLVSHCANVLRYQMHAWSMSLTPEKMQQEHLQARAARLVISWIEDIQGSGKVAEQLITQQDTQND